MRERYREARERERGGGRESCYEAGMVLVGAVRDYLNRMLNDIPGMKVLILDAQTVMSLSLALILCFDGWTFLYFVSVFEFLGPQQVISIMWSQLHEKNLFIQLEGPVRN